MKIFRKGLSSNFLFFHNLKLVSNEQEIFVWKKIPLESNPLEFKWIRIPFKEIGRERSFRKHFQFFLCYSKKCEIFVYSQLITNNSRKWALNKSSSSALKRNKFGFGIIWKNSEFPGQREAPWWNWVERILWMKHIRL